MEIIDLLNKIANGEELPKKIKYRKCIFEYEEKYKDYFTKDGIIPTTFDSNGVFRNIFANYNNFLNDEVEILEEEKETKPLTKKDIEALGYACGEITKSFTNGWTKSFKNKSLEEEKKIPEKLDHLIGYDIQQFDDLKKYVYQ